MSRLKASDNVSVLLLNADGRAFRKYTSHNELTTLGLQKLRHGILQGTRGSSTAGWGPDYLAFGSGDTAATSSDEALETPHIGLDMKLTRHQVLPKKILYQCFISTSDLNGGTIRELGLFDAPDGSSGGGTLFARAIVTDIVKTAALQIIVNWTVAFDNA